MNRKSATFYFSIFTVLLGFQNASAQNIGDSEGIKAPYMVDGWTRNACYDYLMNYWTLVKIAKIRADVARLFQTANEKDYQEIEQIIIRRNFVTSKDAATARDAGEVQFGFVGVHAKMGKLEESITQVAKDVKTAGIICNNYLRKNQR